MAPMPKELIQVGRVLDRASKLSRASRRYIIEVLTTSVKQDEMLEHPQVCVDPTDDSVPDPSVPGRLDL